MDTAANSVAGIHRAAKPATMGWLWGSAAIVWLVFTILSLRKGDAVRILFDCSLAVMYLLPAWAMTRAHTLVDEDGIRVSQGIGGRRIDWDAIASVSKSDDRWDPHLTLTVTTDAGKDVLTHVPKPLRADFIEYANAYRSSELPALD
ncbi:PH domain-containing protein [Terrabacter sp. BE26]|uniref:PH domain-containing protein n=1 Tax=Terrabacter sp. BE26 TaxID=2898152 RepID=UPI0035BE428C